MTIRTGKGGKYRYYACSTRARQGPTACEGMAVPMEKLDDLVAGYLENQLLQPERLETILASVLDRRQEQGERRREHIAELNKRATESDLRLDWTYPGKVESFPEVKGKLDDEAATIYEGILGRSGVPGGD